MNEIVTDYGELVRTGETVDRLIEGTAFFPGGTGLWRGDRYGGPIPEFFPERPVMFLGHNFDSKKHTVKHCKIREKLANLFGPIRRAF
jgi:hypothetical protein